MAHAHALEVIRVVVEEKRIVRRLRVSNARPQRARIASIDRSINGWRGCTNDLRKCWKEINRHPRHIAHGPRRNVTRPTHEAWFTHTAFEGCAFAFTQSTRAARISSERKPRTVVACEHENCVVAHARSIKRAHHFAD